MRVDDCSPECGFVRPFEDKHRKGFPALRRDVRVADRQRGAEHLRDHEIGVLGIGHLDAAVDADAEAVTELVDLMGAKRIELLRDGGDPIVANASTA
jgi:hypothetical protein